MTTSDNFVTNVLAGLRTDPARYDESALISTFKLARLAKQCSTYNKSKTYSVADPVAARELLRKYLFDQGFIYTEMGATQVYWQPNSLDFNGESIVTVKHASVTLEVGSYGDLGEYVKIFAQADALFPQTGVVISTAIAITDRNTLRTQESYLHASADNQGRCSFYPQLRVPMAEYFDQFLAAKESVLFLIGSAGTGKSTFIRSLILHTHCNAMVAYDNVVVSSPVLARSFFNSAAKVLVLEDVDHYIGKRTDGNTLMSSYLNAAEGIVSNRNKKVIFSTNLTSINKVDEALLRRGRCYDIITFDSLTVEEARAVEVDMGLPAQDLSTSTRWTLSDVLNPPREFLQSNNRRPGAIGFNSKP